jgi:hypothetical protein
MVWTVRGVTERGVFVTSPATRSPGHLLSPTNFAREYRRVAS